MKPPTIRTLGREVSTTPVSRAPQPGADRSLRSGPAPRARLVTGDALEAAAGRRVRPCQTLVDVGHYLAPQGAQQLVDLRLAILRKPPREQRLVARRLARYPQRCDAHVARSEREATIESAESRGRVFTVLKSRRQHSHISKSPVCDAMVRGGGLRGGSGLGTTPYKLV